MHDPNDPNDKKLDRRSFLNQAAGVVAGSAFASSALSYDRILGANDRIALGHIGIGNRGSGLHMMVSRLKDKHNVETVAVCDLWKSNRERAAANSERYYGRAPRAFQHLEELLALKDVDAVLIATPEHSHSPVLKAAVEAGKDAYCEKPMGNVLAGSQSRARRRQAVATASSRSARSTAASPTSSPRARSCAAARSAT